MSDSDRLSPWVFGTIVTVFWLGVFTTLELVFFDENLTRAAILGVTGGVAFAVGDYMRHRES